MRSQIFRNLPYCIFIGVFCLGDAFFTPYIVLYFTDCGLTTTQASLAYSGMTVGSILGGLALGYIADSTHNARKTLCVSMLFAAAQILALQKCTGFAAMAGAIFLYGFFDLPAVALFDNIIVQNVPDWNRSYNVIQTFGNVGYVVGILIAGNVLARFGYQAVFTFAIMMLAVSALSCGKMGNAGKKRKKGKVPLGKLFHNWMSFYIYFSMFLWGVIETGSLAYATKYYTDLGYSAGYAAVMIAIAVTGQILSYYFLYTRPNALPNQALCSAGFALLGVRILSMALVNALPYPVLVLMAFFGGACTPLTTMGVVRMISRNFPKEVSNSAQTFKSIAYRGLGGSLGSYIFGVLYGHIPAQQLMLLAAGVSVGFGVLLAGVYRVVTCLDQRRETQNACRAAQ